MWRPGSVTGTVLSAYINDWCCGHCKTNELSSTNNWMELKKKTWFPEKWGIYSNKIVLLWFTFLLCFLKWCTHEHPVKLGASDSLGLQLQADSSEHIHMGTENTTQVLCKSRTFSKPWSPLPSCLYCFFVSRI